MPNTYPNATPRTTDMDKLTFAVAAVCLAITYPNLDLIPIAWLYVSGMLDDACRFQNPHTRKEMTDAKETCH